MSNEKAPERIYMHPTSAEYHMNPWPLEAGEYVEYVRVDLFRQLEQERDAQRQEIENAERYQAKLLAPTASTRRAIFAAVLTFLLVLVAYAIMIRLIG